MINCGKQLFQFEIDALLITVYASRGTNMILVIIIKSVNVGTAVQRKYSASKFILILEEMPVSHRVGAHSVVPGMTPRPPASQL